MANKIRLGNKVMVSDPCYGIGTWCQGVLENVREGIYNCFYTRDSDRRIASIRVAHESYYNENGDLREGVSVTMKREDFTVGVDSGQAGIFDYAYYEKYHKVNTETNHVDDYWYEMVCSKTAGLVKNPNYIPFNATQFYKDTMAQYKKDLEELKVKYPEIDVEAAYKKVEDRVDELIHPNLESFDLGGLLDVLRDINSVLKGDGGQKVDTRSESQKALEALQVHCEIVLQDKLIEYDRTREGSEEAYEVLASVVGDGYVSSSGWGDGSYICVTERNDEGEIVAITVDYSVDDEDEEEYNEV